jgi:hypothetical protein
MNAWKWVLGTAAIFAGGAIVQDHRRPPSPLRKTPEGPIVQGMDGSEIVLELEKLEWAAPLLRLGAGRPAATVMIDGRLEQYTLDLPTLVLVCPCLMKLTMEDEGVDVWVHPGQVKRVEPDFVRIADGKVTTKIVFRSGSELRVAQDIETVCRAMGHEGQR